MPIQDEVQKAVINLTRGWAPDSINNVLAQLFDGMFAIGGYDMRPDSVPAAYTHAVRRAFYTDNCQLLPAQSRECALVALLASQGAEANLALHIFIAAAAGIPVDDIVDLLFLTGIYCGANLLTKSLRVAAKTFDAIIQADKDGVRGPAAVFRAVVKEFPDPAFDLAAARLKTL